jgi:opacity protein-like surface antigen
MTGRLRFIGSLRLSALAGLLLLACVTQRPASAADMPGANYLRGSLWPVSHAGYSRWDGLFIGAHYGWSNLSTVFQDFSEDSITTNGSSYGGFIGYNYQWDELVVGFDGGYSRPNALDVLSNNLTQSQSFKLVDYATFRARAGYAFGQFLPYAFVGGAVGRVDYEKRDIFGNRIEGKDNAYTAGIVAGLGIDVKLLPNVFLRGEWEYIAFAPVGDIRSQINTARVGIGISF